MWLLNVQILNHIATSPLFGLGRDLLSLLLAVLAIILSFQAIRMARRQEESADKQSLIAEKQMKILADETYSRASVVVMVTELSVDYGLYFLDVRNDSTVTMASCDVYAALCPRPAGSAITVEDGPLSKGLNVRHHRDWYLIEGSVDELAPGGSRNIAVIRTGDCRHVTVMWDVRADFIHFARSFSSTFEIGGPDLLKTTQTRPHSDPPAQA